jgi:hypothetical protein
LVEASALVKPTTTSVARTPWRKGNARSMSYSKEIWQWLYPSLLSTRVGAALGSGTLDGEGEEGGGAKGQRRRQQTEWRCATHFSGVVQGGVRLPNR